MKAKIKYQIQIEQEFDIDDNEFINDSQLYSGKSLKQSSDLFNKLVIVSDIENYELPEGYVEDSFKVKSIEIL